VGQLKEVVDTALASGIPQQLVQIGGNLATSFVQAGAQQPAYAAVTAIAAINILSKTPLINEGFEGNALKTVVAAYIASDIATKIGGFTSKSQSNAMTFDVPDVPVPRLQRFQPSVIDVPLLPKLPRRAKPEALAEPIAEPALQITRSPVLEPSPELFSDPTGQPILAEDAARLTAAEEAAIAVGGGVAAAGGAASFGATRGTSGSPGAGGLELSRRATGIGAPT